MKFRCHFDLYELDSFISV